jgi:predicted PurR-regulated permease PerM
MPPQTFSTSALRHFIAWAVIFAVLFSFTYAIRSMLLPFILGIMIAYFLNPLTLWLQKKKLPRAAAAGIIIASFLGISTITLTKLIPVLYNQALNLLEILPSYAEDLYRTYFPQMQVIAKKLGATPSTLSPKAASASLAPQLSQLAERILSGIMGSGAALMNLGSLFIITPVVAFYILKDWVVIVHKVDDLLPRRYAPVIREQISLIDTTIAGFIRGQINVCLIIATYYCVALSFADLNFAFAIGIFSGIMLIIPYAGTILSAGIALAVMWFQTQDTQDLITIGSIYGVGMLLDSYLVTPKLVGEKVGLHPVWIIFGMLAGAVLFGFVGVLLAIPVSAVIGVLLRFAIAQYRSSSLYSDSTP